VGVKVWDRLHEREATLPSGRLPFGRFILVDGNRSLSLGGRTLLQGDYLASPGEWTLWDESSHTRSHGGCDIHALPDETTAQTILALGARLDRLRAEEALPQRWLDETPLMERADLEPRIRRRGLDDEIQAHLDALRDVCHNPADRLRVVNRLVPVGAARRIVPATIVRLAGHSEDWNRLRPESVEPNVVLTPFRETNLDFYENRVAARLVDHLWRDSSDRLAAVMRIDTMLADIERYIAEAVERPWRLRGKLFRLIKGVADNQAWRELATARRAELEDIRDALAAVRGRQILPGVDRYAEIGTALRATNLFVNEHRYRRVRHLWRAWVDDRTGAGSDSGQVARIQDFCRAFAAYTGLLLLHALDHLGVLGPEAEAVPLKRGALPIGLGGATRTTTTMTWLPSDVFELATDGRPVLRIVPLPHAITREGRSAVVGGEIEQLTAQEPVVPTLIVYPGSHYEAAGSPRVPSGEPLG
jgi:hypothetical protein